MILYKDIIKEENEHLREKSIPVSLPLLEKDIYTLRQINAYLEAGYDPELVEEYELRPGVGLAAPQIDVLKRMFVILAWDEMGDLHHYGVINPVILSQSVETTFMPTGEGCLSVDRDVIGLVHRPKRIKARAHLYDFDTNTVEEKTFRLSDYIAVVFQHEYDHLNGVLFYDHINTENPWFIPENSSPVVFQAVEPEEEEETM